MKKILLGVLLYQCIYGHAENTAMEGCAKVESIENLSFMHAVFQTCGFNNQPKQKLLLKRMEQMDNELCNFSSNEIKPDQNLINMQLKEIQGKNLSSNEKSELCKKTSDYLQTTIKEYEDSKKPKYKVGSFDDPNIPAGYVQQCQMHYGRLQQVADMYDDVYFGKMPMALADQSLNGYADMSTTYPYNTFQLKAVEKKIKSIIFSKKDHEKELYEYLHKFEYQCLKDIAEFDKQRMKRNSYHNYSQD